MSLNRTPEIRLAFDVTPEEIVRAVAGAAITTRPNEAEQLTKVSFWGNLGHILYFHPWSELLIGLPSYRGSTDPVGLDMNATAVMLGGGSITLVSRIKPGIEVKRGDLVIVVSMGARRFAYNVLPEDECSGETLQALKFIDRKFIDGLTKKAV